MGFFANLKKKKEEKIKAAEEQRKAEEEKRKAEEEQRKAKERQDLIDRLGLCLDYKHMKFEEQYTKAWENDAEYGKGHYDKKTYRRFYNIYHPETKYMDVPSILLGDILQDIDCPCNALDYVGPTEIVIKCLTILGTDYHINDDGEPEPCERIMEVEDLIDEEKNPLLKFLSTFDAFMYEDDEVGSIKDKFSVWYDCLLYVNNCIICENLDVLEKDKWLFDESTFINDFGVLKSEKSFLKYAATKATYKDVFDSAFENKMKEQD